jgi:type II secretory pathway component PulJ
MNRRGLTLIELLVAVICTGLVAYMAWNLVRDEQTNYTRTREKVRLQSDAKEAMRIIEGEMRNLGFNQILVTGSDRRYVSLSACTNATDARIDLAGGDTSSFTYTNSTGVPGGDEVEFRFHQASAAGMTTCDHTGASPLTSISYRFDDGQLQRRYCEGAAVATCATNGTWLPLLDSVVSFHVQYGVENPNAGLVFNTANLTNAGSWTASGDLDVAVNPAAGDTTFQFTGLTGTTKFARFQTPIDTIARGQSYLVSFRILGNYAWTQDGARFGVGFVDASKNTDAATDLVPIQPAFPVDGSQGWTVSTVLSPSVDAIGARYLAFYGQLNAVQSTTGHAVTIRDIAVRRIGRGQYIQWYEAPTVAQKNRVRAVRVSLLVKSRKSDADPAPGTFSDVNLGQAGATYTPTGAAVGYSYILMQRIIPVVNNGNL